jgi:hypothetical protein
MRAGAISGAITMSKLSNKNKIIKQYKKEFYDKVEPVITKNIIGVKIKNKLTKFK